MFLMEIMSFYDIGKLLIGEVPVQFEWIYSIFALVSAIAFIAIILSFIGFSFKQIKRN